METLIFGENFILFIYFIYPVSTNLLDPNQQSIFFVIPYEKNDLEASQQGRRPREKLVATDTDWQWYEFDTNNFFGKKL